MSTGDIFGMRYPDKTDTGIFDKNGTVAPIHNAHTNTNERLDYIDSYGKFTNHNNINNIKHASHNVIIDGRENVNMNNCK